MFDQQDTQPAAQREQLLFNEFSERLAESVQGCAGLQRHLHGYSLGDINGRESLQTLPILRKNDLMQAQQAFPPFGEFVNLSALEGQRVFMSPGPVWEPQIPSPDPWQCARALHAAGIRRGHRVHNAFSYHLTPGGFILDEGARELGCIVFPAGVGGTEAQVQAIRQFSSQVYVGTPDYLQILLDAAAAEGNPLTSIERALVSGGALFPAMRDRYAEQGIHVQQCYATADLGVIAYETATDGVIHPGMVVNEGLIVEVVVPGTSVPVAPGDVGEIVVTRLNPVYPLIRFATGDLSAVMDEPSPCGRTQLRLRGWLGRADQRVKVRGMFVDPQQLQSLPVDFPQLSRWRLCVARVDNRDDMRLSVTLKNSVSSVDENETMALTEQLTAALKAATGLKGAVSIVEALPNDGVVIEDQRDYETNE